MSDQIKIISSKADFEQAIAQGVVLVDFGATWCGPCRMQLPILDDLATKFQGKATIVKVDVDQNSDLAGEFRVESIPTLLIFNNGAMVEKFVGAQSEGTLTQALNKFV